MTKIYIGDRGYQMTICQPPDHSDNESVGNAVWDL